MMYIEFGEDDLMILNEVFGDTDNAQAATNIIQDAPPEIQIIAVQLIKMIEGNVNECSFKNYINKIPLYS